MARDIYSFNWSRLRDAYGPATKVPDLLDAALNKSERAAVDALCDLSNRLCHQGVGVDNAAVPAMPVLAEVTERTEPDVRIMAVSMFADMAEASRIIDRSFRFATSSWVGRAFHLGPQSWWRRSTAR